LTALRLVVTAGDPLGIGPEVVVKALASGAAGDAEVLVLGDAEVVAATARRLGLGVPHVEDVGAKGALSALRALEEACRAAREGRADAIVTAPVHKADLVRHGFRHPGQTEFLGEALGGVETTMMLAGPALRVALVTTHLRLLDVPAAVTRPRVERTIRRVRDALAAGFGIPLPRIAVLGLNPHAGEEGLFGPEDAEVVRPAVETCAAEGIDCTGPLAGDGTFAPHVRERFDAFVAMYHDQGLAALKAVHGGEAVNVTLGLPVPRTSPDHGTARDLAGRGTARATSMEAAIRLAVALARRL